LTAAHSKDSLHPLHFLHFPGATHVSCHLLFKMAYSLACTSEQCSVPFQKVGGMLFLNLICCFSIFISLFDKLKALLSCPYLLMISNWKNQNL